MLRMSDGFGFGQVDLDALHLIGRWLGEVETNSLTMIPQHNDATAARTPTAKARSRHSVVGNNGS